MIDKPINVWLTGGGTLGPVTPLVAIREAWKQIAPQAHFTWIGTSTGPEGQWLKPLGDEFLALPAPKFDRTRPWTWPLIPFQFAAAFLYATNWIRAKRPDIIFTAGAYVSVPIAYAGWLCRVPVWVHQLDVTPGLSNRLMAPVAARVSVTFPESTSAFPKLKTIVAGGLVRQDLARADSQAWKRLRGLKDDKPVILVLGGGTGATAINQAMEAIAPEILQVAQVVHLTGIGKLNEPLRKLGTGYLAFELLDKEMPAALKAADLVVCRAGLGTILELVALKKPAIVIPLPDSPQEANAALLEKTQAAVVLRSPSPQVLAQAIRRLLADQPARYVLSNKIGSLVKTNAAQMIVSEAAPWVSHSPASSA